MEKEENLAENKDPTSSYLKSTTECSYCGVEYSKNNKPLVMKCSHNLCQTCHSLNKNFAKCMMCGAKYEGKENRRYPINFLLLEIIERNQNNPVSDKKKKRKKSLKDNKEDESIKGPAEIFRCSECNLNFPNRNHLINHPDHTLNQESTKEPPEQKSILIKGLEDLMNKYQTYNEKFKNYNETFFSYLPETFRAKKEDLMKEINSNDVLDNFLIFGIINKTDKERIKEFTEKYLSNLTIVKIINESASFDELLIKLSEVKEIKLHNFLSSYFYYEEILSKKLNEANIEKKINKFREEIVKGNSESQKNLFRLFSEDLFVHVYNSLNLEEDINKKIKLPALMTRNGKNLIVFDTLTESIKYFEKINENFPNEFSFLENFSYYVTSHYEMIITGGKLNDHLVVNDCFSLDLNTKMIKHYSGMNERRYNHSSVLANNRLFVIGGLSEIDSKEQLKSFEKLNLSDNTWSRLSSCPHELKNKPSLLNFEDQYIYVIDDLSHFFYYEIKHDKWTICKPSYKGSYNLNLKNFTSIYHNSNVIILGGVESLNKTEEVVNSHIYHLKDIGSLISTKGEFSIADPSSLVDHGFIVDSHYILEYSEEKRIVKIHHTKDLNTYKWNLLLFKEY